MTATRPTISEPLTTNHRPNTLRPELHSIFLILAGVVFIAARLWHLTSYGIFGDEVFTLWTSAQSWPNLFSSVTEDVVHPPLFYVLLKLWIALGGQSLLWIKVLSLLFSIASIIPFVLLCRELKVNSAATTLALWLMAVNGFLIGHAQEMRMYSLLLLLAITSLWLFAKLQSYRTGVHRIHLALCSVNVLLVFTHYFGWIVVALELGFIAVSRRDLLLKFILATLAISVCFSPWVYLVIRAARANPSRATFFWNSPPPLSELINYYGNLNGPLSYQWKVFGTALVMLLFVMPIVVKFARTVRGRYESDESRRFWFLMLFAFGPVALAFLASHLLPQSVWALRYLIIAAPAYLLIVAVSAVDLRRARFGVAAMVLIAGWATLSGFTEMLNRNRVAWEPLVNQMIQVERDQVGRAESEPLPVNICVADPNVGNTIQFYLDQAGETRLRVAPAENIDSPSEKHSWVAFIRYNHEVQPPLEDALAKAGYRVGSAIESTAAGHKAVLFPVWKQ